jgi:sialidase-1
MHAAEGLTLAGLGDEVVAALTPRLPTEADDQRRCGLARELIRAGVEAPVSVLTAILKDTQSKGRVHAGESLFKVNRVGELGALVSALNESNPDLEMMAAAALARQGDTAVLARLRAHLADAELSNRQTAAWVLGQVGGPQDCAPIRALAEAEPDALSRSFYWNALARLGAPGAREVVVRNLDAPEEGVRTYAADALVTCGTAAQLPRLDAMLGDAALDARLRAAEAIVSILAPRPLQPAP